LPHAVVTGLPLRPAIVDLDRKKSRAEAAKAFGLDPERPTLLVFGGSQGAQSINAAVAAAQVELAAAGIQVLQSVGARNDVPTGLSGDPIHVALPYIDRMDLAYAAADFALCRSGAMTVAELTAVGLPAAYVPFPIGNGEQRLNAEPVVAAGGGLLVDDAALSAAWIRAYLIPMLLDPNRLDSASVSAASLGHRDADQKLVNLVKRAVAVGGTP
jgi:UDP-N-acetylglucosamine--N-acetylmuramyl-(pentapeptide) pyrophosphoryl-undecaprenol N-acetylglucosamine transferase